MRFLTGTDLRDAVEKIAAGSNPRFAVAFWGTGSEYLFANNPQRIKVICNLKAGGTNPFVIEKLLERKAEVQQHDTLHAKVYFNDDEAIVASANASANGLGLEGTEQGFWQEAGVSINYPATIEEISAWFDHLWNESYEISNEDIEESKKAWKARQSSKPPLQSFAEFSIDSPVLPLIASYGDIEWEMNVKHAEGLGESAQSTLEDRIDDGIEIEGDEDRRVLTPGVWVLKFKSTSKGLPDRRSRLEWLKTGLILEEAFKLDGEQKFRPVALAADDQGNPPFPLNEKFTELFMDIIQEFPDLRTNNYTGAWFTERRQQKIKEFWRALHKAYNTSWIANAGAAA